MVINTIKINSDDCGRIRSHTRFLNDHLMDVRLAKVQEWAPSDVTLANCEFTERLLGVNSCIATQATRRFKDLKLFRQRAVIIPTNNPKALDVFNLFVGCAQTSWQPSPNADFGASLLKDVVIRGIKWPPRKVFVSESMDEDDEPSAESENDYDEPWNTPEYQHIHLQMYSDL